MNQVFVRSEQLADKIHDIKLYISEWKVLFSLDGRMNENDIAGFLESDLQEVQKALDKLQGMGLVLPEGGEVPVTETGESEEEPVEFQDETLSAFEEVKEETELAEESAFEESELQEFSEPEKMPDLPEDQDLSFQTEEESESEELTAPEEFAQEAGDEFSQLTPDEESEGFEELKIEEPAEESEEGSEQDLDSLINDLLKEESVSDQEGGGPKILDEEEMAQWSEEQIQPESTPSPTEQEEIEIPEDISEAEPETDLKMESDLVEEETIAPPEEDLSLPEQDDLPEVQAEESDQEAAEVTPHPAAEDQKTILVVDDSIVIRKMVEIALENESYNVISVGTGKEAFSYLDSENPDLVILDIMLPDVNGLDILKAIKARTEIPVVMLSAKDTPKETSQAKELGADDFIPKPFRDEELVGKIHELIGE